jgi:hypothetical protein
MSYADLTYYKNTYLGRSVVDAETTKWLSRASDDVDAMTGGFVLEDLTDTQLELVKKATCAQAEYYVMNGDAYNTGAIQSAGIGKFNYSGNTGNRGAFAPRCIQYLEQSGLMFRGLEVAHYV